MIYLILAFAFFIRVLPRIILPNAIADDAYGHCSNADDIRRAGHRIPKYFGKTVFKQVYGYPFFFPYLLSIFPKRYELVIERTISAVFDTLIIYVSSRLFADVRNMPWVANGNTSLIAFTALMTVLPGFLRNDTGPRAYNGSARVVGQFFFLAVVYSAYKYFISSSPEYFLIAVFFGMLILLASTFASQVFVFTGIFIGLIFSIKYFLIIISAFALVYIVTLGKAHQIFTALFRHYEWYFKFYQVIGLQNWSHFKNPVRDYYNSLKMWFGLLFKFKLRSIVIYFNISNNPLHLLITSFFFYFSIFFVFEPASSGWFLNVVCISCLIVYVLTMTKPLLFLGECYRYLEFGVPAALILLFQAFDEKPVFFMFIWVWVIIGLIRYVFFQLDFYRTNKGDDTNYVTYQAFFDRITPLIDGKNVFASPTFRTKAAYFGHFPYLALRAFMDFRYLSMDDNYLAFGNYPHPSGDFDTLIKRFEFKYWLTTNAQLDKYLSFTKEHGDLMERLEIIDREDKIDTVLFRIKDRPLKTVAN